MTATIRKPGLVDLVQRSRLGVGDRGAFTPHEDQFGIEPDARCFADGVQGIEGHATHRLGATGVQRDVRPRLDLEPPDHTQDASIRSARRDQPVLIPQVRPVERLDVIALLVWNVQAVQKHLDLVLGHRNVFRHEPVEQVRPAGSVIRDQNVRREIPKVQDRAVDVEDDGKLVSRIRLAKGRVMPGEGAHPVARGQIGEGHTDTVASLRALPVRCSVAFMQRSLPGIGAGRRRRREVSIRFVPRSVPRRVNTPPRPERSWNVERRSR